MKRMRQGLSLRGSIALCVLLLASFTSSAEPVQTSTQKIHEQPSQSQADALLKEGKRLLHEYDHQAALKALIEALSLYRKLGHHRGEAAALNHLGVVQRRMGAYTQALESTREAFRISKEQGFTEIESQSLRNTGTALARLGKYKQAVTSYQQSLAIAREVSYSEGEANSMLDIGILLRKLGLYNQALEFSNHSLIIFRKLDDREGQASVLLNIGTINALNGKFSQAMEYYQESLAISQSLRDLLLQGNALINIGNVLSHLGKYTESLSSSRKALSLYEQMVYRSGISIALNNIGTIHAYLGAYGDAIESFRKALLIQRELGNRPHQSRTLRNISSAYRDLGDAEQALKFAEQSLAVAQDLADNQSMADPLENIGLLQMDSGEYQEALKHFQEALAIQRELGNRLAEGHMLQRVSSVYHALGEDKKALESATQSLVIAQDLGDQRDEAYALFEIGFALLKMDDPTRALKEFEKALQIYEELGQRPGEVRILVSMGIGHAQHGNITDSIHAFRHAVEIAESIQGELHVDQLLSTFASKYAPLYGSLISLLARTGDEATAFDYAERARARAFLNLLGNRPVDIRQGVPDNLLEREQLLRQRIIALQREVEPIDGTQKQRTPTQMEAMREELQAARAEYEQLLTQLKLQHPEYASMVSVDTLPLKQIQSEILDEQTTLIEYFIAQESVFAWIVDQEGMSQVTLEITPDQLREQITLLRNRLDRRVLPAETLEWLYEAMIAPLQPHIRHRNLILIPHHQLHHLPFAALRNPETERYLLQEYAITYAPSASALRFIRDKRTPNDGTLMALGNPDGSLPHAEVEAATVAELYGSDPLLGQQASESRLRNSDAPDLLHLAAHGTFEPHSPLFSRIELHGDESSDGQLQVHEVFNLDLRGTNLVTLSACETARGEISQGDEIIGLNRAFLYAGTPAVLTSLWKIDDEATAALMEAFYRQLRAGATNTEALRQAQWQVMQHEDWNNPYYWAAFRLTGDAQGNGEIRAVKPLQATQADLSPFIAIPLIALLLAGLLVFVRWRWRRATH